MAAPLTGDLKLPLPSAAALLLLVSAGTIAGAWIFEYAGYAPCHLCLMQRYAYYLAIPLSSIALYLISCGQMRLAQGLLIICAAAFIANAALGGYHAGVEWQWWAGPSDCTSTGTMESLMTLDSSKFLQSLKETSVVPCDKPAWTLFGMSLAGFNFFISVGLATLALVATRRLSL